MRAFLNRHSSTMLHPWAGAWVAVPVVVVLTRIGYDRHELSAYAALAGALMAILGVLTLGRPLLRLGYDEWLRQSRIIDGGHVAPTPEEQKAELEERRDAQAIQLSGPLLVILGTLLNGTSGFLS
ncbi:hypothetical protein [Thiocapsa roseopersicina]|uniref:Uncharacterized protein n=1 Tax=Thiocapsa roseopersicina TaxID=1058 RepID=A0A1H3DNI8_THIRO|nr:hypothetical protein [Thiocapsa roseopersicina]SDX67951.1 hypothetical protein SAMN05421783_1549 [Thiocapsa roseopersicina]